MALELWLVVSSRCTYRLVLRAPELLAIGLVGVAYLAHPFLVPGMSALYDTWLPFIARGYNVFHASLRDMARTATVALPFGLLWPILLALPFLLRPLFRNDRTAMACGFSVTALACLAIFFIQHMGWRYHLVAYISTVILASFWLLLVMLTRLPDQYRSGSTAVLCLILVVIAHPQPGRVLGEAVNREWFEYPYSEVDQQVVTALKQHSSPGEKVALFQMCVVPAFPAINLAELKPVTRFLCPFPMAFFHKGQGEMSPYWRMHEQRYYEGLVVELERDAPELLLINETQRIQYAVDGKTIGRYLRDRGFFDTIVSQYEKVGSVLSMDIYRRRSIRVGLVVIK